MVISIVCSFIAFSNCFRFISPSLSTGRYVMLYPYSSRNLHVFSTAGCSICVVIMWFFGFFGVLCFSCFSTIDFIAVLSDSVPPLVNIISSSSAFISCATWWRAFEVLFLLLFQENIVLMHFHILLLDMVSLHLVLGG